MADKVYYVVDTDLKPVLNELAKKHKAKGSDKALFQQDDPWTFQPGFEINSKQYKRIEDDQLLRKLMDKECKPGYEKMLADLDTKVKAFAATCKDGSPKAEELEKLTKTIRDALAAGAKEILDGAKKPLETYLKDRTLGKVEQQKYEAKKVKGGLKITVGFAAIGGAIAGAVASFGASAPTVPLACYGTYLAMRETRQTFKKAARTIDEYAESIDKTLNALKEKYESLPEAERPAAIAAGETKGKFSKELIGFTPQSIKKLEDSLTGYDKAVQIALYCQSRLGKDVGKLQADIAEDEDKLAVLGKLPNPDKKITGKIKKVNESLALIKKEASEKLDAAEKAYGELQTAKTRSEPWWAAHNALKDKRPDWVRHVSKPLKLVGIAVAAANQDFSEAAEQGAMAIAEIGAELTAAAALYADENKKDLKKKKNK